MTQGQATAIIFLLAAILFVLLVGNSVVKLLWLAFVVLYQIPENMTLGPFPWACESDSRRRTQEVRHVGPNTITPGF